MARKKVKLVWIANDATRRATFRKRRKGLLKKVSELATLCGVRACAIIYGPQESLPEAWPSSSDATKILTRFRSLPEMEQCKKMLDQEGFLRNRVIKLHEQFRRMERDNRELEGIVLLHEGLAGKSLHDMQIEEVTSLAWTVEIRLKAIRDRAEVVKARMATTEVATRGKAAMEAAMEALQRQNWLPIEEVSIDVPSQMVFGGGEDVMMHPFLDSGSPWNNMDPFFPF